MDSNLRTLPASMRPSLFSDNFPGLRSSAFFCLPLLGVLLIKAVAMILLIQFSGLELAPDEAQYWTWSQKLDWGYYSKPPGIALEIWLGTKLLGNNVLGVRIGAVVFSFFISLAVYALALASGLQKREAFWASIISSLTPMGFFASYYATTDIGLALFWTLACIPLAIGVKKGKHSVICVPGERSPGKGLQGVRCSKPLKGLTKQANEADRSPGKFSGDADNRMLTKKGTAPNYIPVGLFVALGALFKWPIYLIWAVVLIGMVRFPSLRSRSFAAGVFISLSGLIPPLIWNASRGWPTFQHVWSTIRGGHGSQVSGALFKGNFFDFMGAQAALLTPVFFAFLIFGFYLLFKHSRPVPPPIRLFGMASFAILAAYQSFSLFQKMQGNWCVFVYPMAIVFLSWALTEVKRRWLYLGLLSSFVLVGLIFTLPSVQINGIAGFAPIPLKINRMKECMGWGCIADALSSAGYSLDEDFLVSDSYQMTSLLSFYAPGQKRAYFHNIRQRRHNQFSYWPSLAAEQLGKSGFFAALEDYPVKGRSEEQAIEEFKNLLMPYFKEVKFNTIYPLLFTYGKPRKVLLIFRLEEYNGRKVEEPKLF